MPKSMPLMRPWVCLSSACTTSARADASDMASKV
jgi:hypothetical protein